MSYDLIGRTARAMAVMDGRDEGDYPAYASKALRLSDLIWDMLPINPDDDPVVEAIRAVWGPRCSAVVPGCPVCAAWARYDMLALSEPAVAAWNSALCLLAERVNNMPDPVTGPAVFDLIEKLALQNPPKT